MTHLRFMSRIHSSYQCLAVAGNRVFINDLSLAPETREKVKRTYLKDKYSPPSLYKLN